MNGIFITVELEGALAARIHALQERFDPRLAREFPPHVTLIGSSGAGPIDPASPLDDLRARVTGVTSATPPIAVTFERPIRFIGREIVVLPLQVHGPLRALHEAIRGSGIRYETARWPFTPHCTLNFYPTLTADSLRDLLAVHEPEPWMVHTLRVYHTRDNAQARLLFEAELGGAPMGGDRPGPPLPN